jgi:hypothetical protein
LLNETVLRLIGAVPSPPLIGIIRKAVINNITGEKYHLWPALSKMLFFSIRK